MTFASVYPHYITKVEKKGRSKSELHQVIQWLTGFNEEKLQELIQDLRKIGSKGDDPETRETGREHGTARWRSFLAGTASATGAWDCAMVFMGIEETLPAYRHACAANGYRHLDIRTRPGQAWRSWPSFYRALDALAPEVIVLHSVKAILPAALYAWRRSIPRRSSRRRAGRGIRRPTSAKGSPRSCRGTRCPRRSRTPSIDSAAP